jgi:hypothetical protein
MGINYFYGHFVGGGQTCAASHFFKEKSSQVIQKSSHDFDFFEKTGKSLFLKTLTFFKGRLENTFRRFF